MVMPAKAINPTCKIPRNCQRGGYNHNQP